MKTLTLFISLFVISTHIFGQWDESNYELNFENDFGVSTLSIDTISNPNNMRKLVIHKKHFLLLPILLQTQF